MKLKIIACEVMKEELLSVPTAYDTEFSFIQMGLHLNPGKLNMELQNQLDQSKEFDNIILAFGLCGGGVRNLKSSGSVIIIPKVHDCISLFLGSSSILESIRSEEPGTFFYSCGWFKGNKSFLAEYEDLCIKYGEEEALMLVNKMYNGYKQIVFIHTGHPEEEDCLYKAGKIANMLNLRLKTIIGKKDYFIKLVTGPWNEDEFIILKPGMELNDSLFYPD